MKRIVRYIKIVVTVVLLLLLFRGFVYRKLINYREIGKRDNIELNNNILTKIIDKKIEQRELNIDEIIKKSNEITSKELSFTFNKVSSNPNKILMIKKANCIGYSSLFNSIGNYIIQKQDLTEKYEFIHLIGKLDFLGYDIHKLFNSPFFRNHDYNEILNKKSNERKFIDPSLSDYLRIENISSE